MGEPLGDLGTLLPGKDRGDFSEQPPRAALGLSDASAKISVQEDVLL